MGGCLDEGGRQLREVQWEGSGGEGQRWREGRIADSAQEEIYCSSVLEFFMILSNMPKNIRKANRRNTDVKAHFPRKVQHK